MTKIFLLTVMLPLASAFWTCQTTPNDPTCNADTEKLCPGPVTPFGCAIDGSCRPKFDTGRLDNNGNPCPTPCPPGCNAKAGQMPCPPKFLDNGCIETPVCVNSWNYMNECDMWGNLNG